MNPVRRRSLLLALVCAFALPLASGQQVSGDLAKIQGTWNLSSGSKDGKPLAASDVANSRIAYKGNKVEMQTPHQSAETIRATIKLGTEGNRKTLEWVRDNGPDAGKTMLAIYEFRGDDELVIVFAPAGKPRPKEFATKPGSSEIMHVWKRAKS